MTREEKQKAIDALKISAPVMAVTQEEFNDYIQTINQIMDWLEQEPTTKNDLGVDTVSRKAVHDMLENLPITVEDKWFNWLQKACMRLADLPSVTPQEPKTGHWKEEFNDIEGEVRFTCSSCGKFQLFGTDFCYHCGARMVEPQESE